MYRICIEILLYFLYSGCHMFLWVCTLAPVSLQSVCSKVFRVRCGTSLFNCFSFSLGKTFMKLWTSSRMRSRLILLMVSGRKRIILHRHCREVKSVYHPGAHTGLPYASSRPHLIFPAARFLYLHDELGEHGGSCSGDQAVLQ